jgi:hypothetical protein
MPAAHPACARTRFMCLFVVRVRRTGAHGVRPTGAHGAFSRAPHGRASPVPAAYVAAVSPVPVQMWTHLLVERVHRQLRRRLDPLLNRVGDVRHDLSANKPHNMQRNRTARTHAAVNCAPCRTQHAMCSRIVQHEKWQHATCSTRNTQLAAHQMATCNMQRAARATYSM